MMSATLPLALLLMDAEALREFVGSGLATLGFASNFWFWLEDSYVAEPSAFKPLLHTCRWFGVDDLSTISASLPLPCHVRRQVMSQADQELFRRRSRT